MHPWLSFLLKQCATSVLQLVLFVLLLGLLQPTNVIAQDDSQDMQKFDCLLEMSIEELSQVHIVSNASLTGTSIEEAPATITLITRDMIDTSGARSLDELLELFVPNFQRLTNTFAGSNFGIRGITSSTNDKLLLRVNGRIMNHKAFYGADSEFMLSMLGDIRRIEVIRGPGAALYGPGALSGVIDIQTFDARNFDGVQVTARQGVIEGFSSLQLKMGHTFKNDHGVFLFYGIDKYTGASKKHAPTRVSQAIRDIPAHTDLPFNLRNHRRAYENQLRHKAHFQYSGANDLEFWVRFTAGGEELRGSKENYFLLNEANSIGVAYRQLTATLDKKWKINEELELNLLFSYDIYDRKRNSSIRRESAFFINLREDEYLSRIQLNWSPSQKNQLALGSEFTYEEFGKAPVFFSSNDVVPLTSNSKPWHTTMLSFFGEHQFRPNDNWRLISGARIDLHSRIEPMFSPRIGLIYTPTDQDVAKLIVSQSVRRTSDFFSQQDYLVTRKKTNQTETLKNIELSYKRNFTKSLHARTNATYSGLDIIDFVFVSQTDALTNTQIGTMKFGNLEFEFGYKTDKNLLSVSHTITHLFNFDLEDNVTGLQFISASPFGFGNKLAAWSNHTTKFYWNHIINPSFAVNVSGFVYWGFDGARDWANYNRNFQINTEGLTFYENNDKAFGSNVFINASVQYNVNKNMQLMVTGHNLFGLINRDSNKRNSVTELGTYTLEASALSLTLRAQY